MKKITCVLVLIPLFWGCDKDEIIVPREETAKLTINWQHPFYGNSSEKNSAMIYLYDSEEEYNTPLGTPVFRKSLSDIYPDGGGVITPVSSGSFDNLEPKKYWVKIFNAYRHQRFVEFNTDSANTFEYPLIENTHTTVTIPTKRVYVNSYTIEKIEIYDIPSSLDINNGDQINAKILASYPSSSYRNEVLDSKPVVMNNSSIVYEPTDVTIENFYPFYDLILNKPGSLSEEFYEIKIFELLNSNAHFGNVYIKLNDQNEIKYKLYVTWNID